MKNYIIVFNSITACLLFGIQFFTRTQNQDTILLCWLAYLILILLPAAFADFKVSVCSSAAAVLLIVLSNPAPELFLLCGFQITSFNRTVRLNYLFRLLPYMLFGPLVPVHILHIYVFSALLLFAFDIALDLTAKRKKQADEKYSLLKEKADDLAEKFEQQADYINKAGFPRLEKTMETFRQSHELKFVIEGTNADRKFPRDVWNVIVNNANEFFINSTRHSAADTITISFQKFEKFNRIIFRDNGGGCSHLHNGAGLEAMNRRTIRAGGNLVVKGLPVFSVIMLFPGEEK